MSKKATITCPCDSGNTYQNCCESVHLGKLANTAETLMRSRYTAYVLGLEDYLLATWHPETRPKLLNLTQDHQIKWLGLQVKQSQQLSEHRTIVEFIARYKIGGNKAERLHEISEFVYTDRWYYLRAVNQD